MTEGYTKAEYLRRDPPASLAVIIGLRRGSTTFDRNGRRTSVRKANDRKTLDHNGRMVIGITGRGPLTVDRYGQFFK
jgi:hypothetical protein